MSTPTQTQEPTAGELLLDRHLGYMITGSYVVALAGLFGILLGAW